MVGFYTMWHTSIYAGKPLRGEIGWSRDTFHYQRQERRNTFFGHGRTFESEVRHARVPVTDTHHRLTLAPAAMRCQRERRMFTAVNGGGLIVDGDRLLLHATSFYFPEPVPRNKPLDFNFRYFAVTQCVVVVVVVVRSRSPAYRYCVDVQVRPAP